MAIDQSQPLYIFDLGAGTGCFGYLFLKHLKELLKGLKLENLNIRYIMTDIVPENIAFWQKHPKLQEFIKEGMLDFAYYRHNEHQFPLKLIISKENLSPTTISNPVVIIANYFFDTIPQDLFRIKDGGLEEGQITLLVQKELNQEQMSKMDPELIQHLDCQFDYIPISEPSAYYSEDNLNEILKLYLKTFDNIPFMFPIGAFQSIRYFLELTQGRLFLLAGDQAVCTEEQIRQWGEPKISRHGSFSFSVSYHAIASYFRQLSGLGLLTTMPDPLFAVVVAAAGSSPEQLPETRLAFSDFIDHFEPKDYWSLVTSILEQWKDPPLEYLMILLKLGNWDPKNFYAFYDAIRKQIPQASKEVKNRLRMLMHNVWDQFYSISKEDGDFIMNLGVLCYEMQFYEDALFYFQRGIDITGENAQNLTNLSACYRALGNQLKALEYFQKAKGKKDQKDLKDQK